MMNNNKIKEITNELTDSDINYILITSILEDEEYSASLKVSGEDGIGMLLYAFDTLIGDLPKGAAKDLIIKHVSDLISNNKED